VSDLAVAIAGCGYFSRFHQDAWSRLDRVRVVAVADRDPAKAQAAASAFPGAQVFAHADAMIARVRPALVDVATPPETHLALVAAAAGAGAAVLCQKPLAPTYAEAVAVVEAAERAGARLVVHENFRFMPWFREAKRLLEEGAVGTPLAVSFRLRPGDGQGPEAYLARQPYFQAMPRFLVYETAIHLVDVFRFLLGEIAGVFARLKRFNPAIAGEDAGLITFEFAGGALGLFDGNRHIDHVAEDARLTMGTMLLEGTGGAIRLDGEGRLFVKPHGGAEREHAYPWERRGFGGDCVYHQIRHVVGALLDGAPVMNDGRAYLRNLAVEEAIYRSNDEERFVRV
jgi:predicted dehydrogenase